MITTFYLIVFLISVFLTVDILVKNRKIDNILILFCFLLNLNLAGLYLIAASKSVEMVIWANKIMYIGGCYLPYVIFLYITRLANIKINNVIKIFFLVYATVVLFLVMTIGVSPIYYKSVEVVIDGNILNLNCIENAF